MKVGSIQDRRVVTFLPLSVQLIHLWYSTSRMDLSLSTCIGGFLISRLYNVSDALDPLLNAASGLLRSLPGTAGGFIGCPFGSSPSRVAYFRSVLPCFHSAMSGFLGCLFGPAASSFCCLPNTTSHTREPDCS